MARRIVDAGFPTTLWARRPATLEPFGTPLRRWRRSPSSSGPPVTSSASASSTTPGSTRSCAAPTAPCVDGRRLGGRHPRHGAAIHLPAAAGGLSSPPRARRPGERGRPQGRRGRAARDGRRPRRGGRPGPPRASHVRRPRAPRRAARLGTGGQGPEQHGVRRPAGARRRGVRPCRGTEPRPAGRRHDPVQRQRSQLCRRGRHRQRVRPRGPRPFAGELLAKDVGILVDRAGLTDTSCCSLPPTGPSGSWAYPRFGSR